LDHKRLELKVFLLQQGAHEEQNKLSKIAFKEQFSLEDKIELKNQFNDIYGFNAYEVANQLNTSKYKKSKRIRIKTEKIIKENKAFFITITFRDDVLDTTSEKTRRVYVARWLKGISDTYVANVDYGKLKGREHYHAIIQAENIEKTWRYGFIDIKKVEPTWNSSKNLPLYVAKLSHHALKETTKSKRIIYSRKIDIM
jgi:hypothetical protein